VQDGSVSLRFCGQPNNLCEDFRPGFDDLFAKLIRDRRLSRTSKCCKNLDRVTDIGKPVPQLHQIIAAPDESNQVWIARRQIVVDLIQERRNLTNIGHSLTECEDEQIVTVINCESARTVSKRYVIGP
jgi:hypothetical protein